MKTILPFEICINWNEIFLGHADQDYLTHNTVVYRINHPSYDKVTTSTPESHLDSAAQNKKQVYSEMVVQVVPEEDPESILSEDQFKDRLLEMWYSEQEKIGKINVLNKTVHTVAIK